MASLKPFAAARPPAALVQRVAAPPYDVVNTAEARAYAHGNPLSFFRVSRPEIDLAPTVDEHAQEVYAHGAHNLAAFLKDGTLVKDPSPRFYAYAQRMGTHKQLGLVAAASVDEYDQGLIKKHELTRQDKEDDRTHHVDVLGGNDEPVFLTYRARNDIDALMASAAASAPTYDFTTEDGIQHTLWLIPDTLTAQVERAFAGVPHLYIADGHHRSAAASRVHALRKGKPGNHDRFLAVIFPHTQMQIMDYNRVVRDLKGHSPEAFVSALGKDFDVTPTTEKKPAALHQFGLYLQGRWHRLTARAGTFPDTPLGRLDVNILQERVLGPLLGIGDPRTDKRIHFVGGIRGMGELEKLVDKDGWAVAFSMFPTTLDQLMDIADVGQIMPPKSTWFEPKLRSGLFLHLF